MFLKKRQNSVVDGIDTVMQYCPDCDTEYRAEISTCVHCQTTLISGRKRLQQQQQLSKERESRSMLIEPEDTMVPLLAGSIGDMKAVQHKLKAAWVPSILTGEEGCARGCTPELTILIKKEDQEVAAKVLKEDFIESTAISLDDLKYAEAVFDIHAKEVTCPACGCQFSPTVGVCPSCGLNFV